MARPKADIDPVEVRKLAAMQCTNVEIAAFFDVDESTIRKRFPDEIAKGKEEGKITLRRAQFRKALEGNATLLIWLGKQYLGQTDKADFGIDHKFAHESIEIIDQAETEVIKERLSKYLN